MSEETERSELNEITILVKRLREAQESVKENDKKFSARFRNGTNEFLLGSERTWQRMRDGDWTSLMPGKWIARVRHAVTLLDGGSISQEVHEDFPFMAEAVKRLLLLERQSNDRRILLALAPTGTGKTVFARHAVAQLSASRAYVMASPAWREGRKGCKGEGNGPAIATGLYQNLSGLRLRHAGYEEALSQLTDWLSLNPRTVFIDQAERGGIALMTLLIHLVDVTPARFVYLAYPTHYYRVVSATSGSLAEARQFIGRSLKPIFDHYALGTKTEDVACLLRHSGITVPATEIKTIRDRVGAAEGLRTLGDALALARRSADDADRDVDAALLIKSLEEVICSNAQLAKQEKEAA